MLLPGSPFGFLNSVNLYIDFLCLRIVQILKPAEKKAKYPYGGMNMGRPVTPPRKQKKKDAKMG